MRTEEQKKKRNDRLRELRRDVQYVCGLCRSMHSSGDNQKVSRRNRTACDGCYLLLRKAEMLFHSCKSRATSKQLDFDLTVDWIVEGLSKPCPKTGVVYDLSVSGRTFGSRSPISPSVDKKNPAGGYTRDNCDIVCWWYNLAKSTFTDKEVLDFCRRVVSLNT